MDNYQDFRKSHVPKFGSWDYADGLPFTQCFESAYGYNPKERDLYVAGDLYQNDVVTPAVIVVPRPRTKGGNSHAKKLKNHQHREWGYDSSYEMNEPAFPAPAPRRPISKAVDEDLYKIPSELLRPRPKRKGGFGFFSSCLMPVCV